MALQLPPTWFGGDLLNNPDVLAEAIAALGLEDRQVWVVTYTTTTSEFETMLPIFEASFETLGLTQLR